MVEVYGTTGCPTCRMLTNWLERNNIRFDYYDLSKDSSLIEKLRMATGNLTVPQFKYRGTWYRGFDYNQICRIFGVEG